MNISLRIVLIAVSLLTFWFVLRKIRKSQILIEDAFYWIFFGFLLLLLSVFPQIASFMAGIIGFEAPSNFVFVLVISLLLLKLFTLSLKVSSMETKLHKFVEEYAVDHYFEDKNKEN